MSGRPGAGLPAGKCGPDALTAGPAACYHRKKGRLVRPHLGGPGRKGRETMRAVERFCRYAAYDTQSSEVSGTSPSTEKQLVLAKALCEELTALGAENAHVDEYGYVYGWVPAAPGCEAAPALGLIAHMDTAPAFSGTGVTPVFHEHYDGGDVPLPKAGRTIRVKDFPQMKALRGRTLITADGSTLLGADDKAGIAEIMTLLETLAATGAPHGRLCIAFTPDEEIGQGADHFDVQKFGAKYAYTMDGGAEGGVEYENFNAAAARFDITGVSVHPGSAKGVMENALLIAMEVNALLPAQDVPAKTEGYQGFFHVTALSGTDEKASVEYIVRDHDAEKFAGRCALLQQICDRLQAEHPTARIRLKLSESYRNMAEQIAPCMHLIENARAAARAAGIEPYTEAIRGGTDGARLSFMGLPCPNLGTGGHNFHGPYECITVEAMDAVVEMLVHLVGLYAHFEEKGEKA